MSEGSKRYYERHKRLGICVRCNRKATTGFVTCRVCLEKERRLRMARQPLFCGACKKLIQPEERHSGACKKLIQPEERHSGKSFHKLCAQRRRARTYPQRHKLAVLAYQDRHRKLGLCYRCPRKVFKGGLCRKHYRMKRERYYERAAG